MPALSAGPPRSTPAISAPRVPSSLKDSATGGVTSCTSTPIQPRVTLPLLTICSSTILAVDTGMAKPIPIEPPEREKIAVLMPIRLPAASTSAPPELPGLIAASVWMKFSKVLMPRPVRPRAETMPLVTVCPTPNGLPMASTTSPTRSASEEPKPIAGRFCASRRSTARSVSGSLPTTFASSFLPSANATSISSAASTT